LFLADRKNVNVNHTCKIIKNINNFRFVIVIYVKHEIFCNRTNTTESM